MLGARIKYNQDYATIIQENDTHVLLKNNTFHLGEFELKIISDHYKEKFETLRKEKGL